MTSNRRDALGAVVVALVSMLLVVLLMGSVVLLGQSAGRTVRGAGAETHTFDEGPDEVPVLCYHYLRSSPGALRFLKVLGYVVLSLPLLDDNEVWTQSVSTFEKQMRYLSENGFRTVTLDDVVAWQEGRKDLPPRSVAITFDDGDRSVREYALPILRKYGFTATLFVVTDKVGEDWEGVETMAWGDLRELQETGVFEIGSHSHDLHYRVDTGVTALPAPVAASRGEYEFDRYRDWQDVVLDDLATSRTMIRRYVGTEPRYIAWPFGAVNDELDELAREAGFRRSAAMQGGANVLPGSEGDDGVRWIRRWGISARTSMRSFKRIVLGIHETPDA
jgi:peptidoglycan/xylan/chitin deacetylase (PgdA/CDA1 family)